MNKDLFRSPYLLRNKMVIASIILVSFSGSFASAYVVPQASDADAMGDGRIEILRRSGADGEGMDEALKYLEELDKYYAQVARPRYVFYITFAICKQSFSLSITNIDLNYLNRNLKIL